MNLEDFVIYYDMYSDLSSAFEISSPLSLSATTVRHLIYFTSSFFAPTSSGGFVRAMEVTPELTFSRKFQSVTKWIPPNF